jgi:hypothetical protein
VTFTVNANATGLTPNNSSARSGPR